ncbi:MAG: peptide deformylase [Thermomicrobia bacterium]|nr:peptide deformylase [Thermomicrobia bacterium]MCA1722703.1 peptide deformylase [Thermomicrobia bacterium]
MAKREIVQINTPEGDAILRTRARKISRMDEETLQLARDMVETVVGVGVAIAAPQVGVPLRLIVVDIPPDTIEEDDPGFQMALYNPRVVRRRGGKEIDEEGCLSLRNMYGPVERDRSVVVRAYDMQDRELQITADGFLARVLQHEIDHLDGIMFTDYMENPEAQLRFVPPRDPNAPHDTDGDTADQATERAAVAE